MKVTEFKHLKKYSNGGEFYIYVDEEGRYFNPYGYPLPLTLGLLQDNSWQEVGDIEPTVRPSQEDMLEEKDVTKLVAEIRDLNNRLKEAIGIIEGLCFQFAYRRNDDDNNELYTAGLSVLEDAFYFMRWLDPHYYNSKED